MKSTGAKWTRAESNRSLLLHQPGPGVPAQGTSLHEHIEPHFRPWARRRRVAHVIETNQRAGRHPWAVARLTGLHRHLAFRWTRAESNRACRGVASTAHQRASSPEPAARANRESAGSAWVGAPFLRVQRPSVVAHSSPVDRLSASACMAVLTPTPCAANAARSCSSLRRLFGRADLACVGVVRGLIAL